MWLAILAFPNRTATCAQTVFTDFARPCVSDSSPNDSWLSFDSGTPEIRTPSLPEIVDSGVKAPESIAAVAVTTLNDSGAFTPRSEEHTSELQSHSDLVCRLLPEKKKSAATADRRRR